MVITKRQLQATYLEWLANEQDAEERNVRAARDYYEGDQPTQLTARLAEFLSVDSDKSFNVNVCGVIIDTLVERLEVTGFDVKGPDEQAENVEALEKLLSEWWQLNRMDARQDWVHQAALRDMKSFGIVDYDNENQRPRINHDYAFDGSSGVKVHYVPGTYRKVAFASKRWIVDKKTRRLNLYFPNRIEKWVNTDDSTSAFAWQPYDEEGLERVTLTDDNGDPYEANVAWWTDNGTASGKPLGVPVVPFINRDDGTGKGISELQRAIPIQDGLNKFVIDLIAAADMTGFQMIWTSSPAPSGENWTIFPGKVFEFVPDENGTVAAGVFPPGDPSGLIAGINTLVALLAGITSTPQSRFTPAAVRPAEGTQRQEEAALVAKVKGLQKVWGNQWEDVMKMCLTVERAFGNAGKVPEVEGLTISASWEDAEIRNELTHVQAVAMKVEKLGVPESQAWVEVGYSADDVREFKKEQRRAKSQPLLNAAKIQAQMQANQQQQPANGNGNQNQPGQQQAPEGVEEENANTKPA